MSYENLLVTEDDGICILTINRPQALNALNYQTFSDLKQFFGEDAIKLNDIKGIIVTGAGDKAFVAGADIKEFLELDREKGSALSRRGQDIFFLIESFPKPVIAAVNGFALGGGCELAMACHMRIAGEKARFGQPEVNLGVIPGYGGTQRLVHYIGKTKALEMLLTGDMLSAEEAYRLGLVNHIVPAGEEVAKAKEILIKIASKGPVAVQKIIECINACLQFDEDGFDREATEFGNATGTSDFKEGSIAFIEKRKPKFQGR
jgi:enoyl-CoA hydratase